MSLNDKLHLARQYPPQIAASSMATLLRRKIKPLPLEPLLQKIDEAEVARLRKIYYTDLKESRKQKGESAIGSRYLKCIPENLEVNARQVQTLGLDRGAPQRILDLGCGAGYFLFICKQLGHDVLGLDTPFVPAYKEMVDLLGVPRVTWTIKAFEPLPDLGAPFDTVTAFRICFNGTKSSELWGRAEWAFFLDDLQNHVKPGGLINLRLNPERDRRYYSDELLQFFLSRGGQVRRATVRFIVPS